MRFKNWRKINWQDCTEEMRLKTIEIKLSVFACLIQVNKLICFLKDKEFEKARPLVLVQASE